jgi:hypothetical protein
MSLAVPLHPDVFTLDNKYVTFCKKQLEPRPPKLFSARALRRLKYYYAHIYGKPLPESSYTITYGIDMECPIGVYTVTYSDEVGQEVLDLDYEDESELAQKFDREFFMEKNDQAADRCTVYDNLGSFFYPETSNHIAHIKTRKDGLSYSDWEEFYWEEVDELLQHDHPQIQLEDCYFNNLTPYGKPEVKPEKRQYKEKFYNKEAPPKIIFRVSRMGTSVEFDTELEASDYKEKYGGTITQGYSTLLNGGAKKKQIKRRKGRGRPRRMPMIRNVQLGQINKMNGLDRPIVTTLRYNASLITDGSGTLSARFSLRNPLTAFNGSGPYVSAVDYATLYDQYKIKAFCFQFQPAATGPSKGGVVLSYDYDSLDSAGTPNYANILNYGRYANFAVNMQFESSTRVPNITSAINTSTDPPTALIVHQGGWIDAATPAAPGHMYIGGINLGNSVTLGTFVLTLRTAWRFRR